MISTTFDLTKFISGPGASKRVGLKAKELGITKFLVLYDKGVKSVGLIEPILENLKSAGIEYVTYDGVLPDPPTATVYEAHKIAIDNKVDGLLAIGGGSTMDTLKAVNTMIANNEDTLDYLYMPQITESIGLKTIAIPTTPATGSEATAVSVITNEKTGAKAVVFSPTSCRFDIALIDAELQIGLPLSMTGFSAFDVITHSVDAIISENKNIVGLAAAEKAFRDVFIYLPKVFENPKDLHARQVLAEGSALAGIGFYTCGLHFTHSFGHAIGAAFHLPHGLCCAYSLKPLFERHYWKWYPKEVRILADLAGVKVKDGASDEEVGKTLADFFFKVMKDCGMKMPKEYDLTKEQLLSIVPLVIGDASQQYAPFLMTVTEIAQIIEDISEL